MSIATRLLIIGAMGGTAVTVMMIAQSPEPQPMVAAIEDVAPEPARPAPEAGPGTLARLLAEVGTLFGPARPETRAGDTDAGPDFAALYRAMSGGADPDAPLPLPAEPGAAVALLSDVFGALVDEGRVDIPPLPPGTDTSPEALEKAVAALEAKIARGEVDPLTIRREMQTIAALANGRLAAVAAGLDAAETGTAKAPGLPDLMAAFRALAPEGSPDPQAPADPAEAAAALNAIFATLLGEGPGTPPPLPPGTDTSPEALEKAVAELQAKIAKGEVNPFTMRREMQKLAGLINHQFAAVAAELEAAQAAEAAAPTAPAPALRPERPGMTFHRPPAP